MRRLPPLNALRSFEAGARSLSFTEAAKELNVTQAAVSHQVKSLEEQLGFKLFHRLTRKLLLTDEGQQLLPVVSESFDRIAATILDLQRGGDDTNLSVSLTPTFSSKWLVKRLERFWKQNPEIDLRLHHSLQLVDFIADEIDVAIRAGDGRWPGVTAEFLIGVDMVPVCSPALLEGPHPLRTPSDLKHHDLLHEDNHEDWVSWLTLAGVTDVDPHRGTIIDDSSVMIEAVAGGRGVALGRIMLIGDDLAAGRLVRPFDLSLESSVGYYLVMPPEAGKKAKVQAFREFLMAEAATARTSERD
ncbi:transcriptional regulator GcvA [Denitrobaculum tricleocarpae]|uniref:Transcriptional regulator GcvA n=1 Tax=Denitrobaculum tricleocarpae TaxID=2591009 RepID=A0A545TKN8_9PROT|nr:transcriptional regulator GcvA [Denitrobaculum tricleocarpae]TQV77731.1 transcriptional regulator GcvA [Denitrobaculum tricleocarpae]